MNKDPCIRTKICLLVMALMMSIPCVMSQRTCPVLSNATVSLSSSVEEDGRQFACPGEHVIFTCEVNRSVIIRISAENFICRNDPVSYLATDAVGSPGRTNPEDLFQANLTNVQRESNLIANFTVTLTTNTTNETSNTVVECGDVLTADLVKSKNLIQSSPPSTPTGLNHSFECDPSNPKNCEYEEQANGILFICRCQSYDLILTWDDTSGMFDLQHYLVNISGNITNITNVTTTSFIVPVMPEAEYLVLVRAVSRCQKTSPAAMIKESSEGIVRAPANTSTFTSLVEVVRTVVPPPGGTSEGTNIAIIAGSAVAIGILLLVIILLVIIVVVILFKRKNKGIKFSQIVPDEGGDHIMDDQQTPLHVEAEEGNLDKVKSLIHKGADVSSRDSNGRTPLHMAARGGHADIMACLWNKAVMNIKDNDGMTPLHVAARGGYERIVDYLVSRKADINIKDSDGWTPLHIAAKEGNVLIVKLLVKAGTGINIRSDDGMTPLHMATERGRFGVVKFLVHEKADTEMQDNKGRTPLDVADERNHNIIKEYLAEEVQDTSI